MQSLEGEQESWGAESAIAPRLAAARMAWLAKNHMLSFAYIVLRRRHPYAVLAVGAFLW